MNLNVNLYRDLLPPAKHIRMGWEGGWGGWVTTKGVHIHDIVDYNGSTRYVLMVHDNLFTHLYFNCWSSLLFLFQELSKGHDVLAS